MVIVPVIQNILRWMIHMSSMSSFTLQGSDWHYRSCGCRLTPLPVLPPWRIPVLYTRLYASNHLSLILSGTTKHLR
jgi:hypothetical protein